MKLMLCGVAVLLLIFVQSSNPIISIHRSSSAKPSCENSALANNGIESNSEESFCDLDLELGKVKDFGYNSEYLDGETPVAFSKSSAMYYSLFSALLVGLSGIFPLLMIPHIDEEQTKDSKTLNRLLSFAVGGLLGDVFLHLLPESWNIPSSGEENFHSKATTNGLWVLCGLISFCLLEKLLPDENSDDEEVTDSSGIKNVTQQNCNGNNNVKNSSTKNGDAHGVGNGKIHTESSDSSKETAPDHVSEKSHSKTNVKMSGYLNLFANCIDNFTHGLAIGGSYLVSRWVGILTTAAILLHEIPHEVGDFAILLRAGFDRWKAAKLQLVTATGGIIGAAFAHFVDSEVAGGRVAWILPFTSGGFIYIALCTIVPDLLRENTSPKESIIQMLLMISAIGIMGLVSLIE